MIINNIDISLRGLFLTNLEVGEAEPKTNYIDIPYGNGSIDLTEFLGYVTYRDRQIKTSFLIKDYDQDNYNSIKKELHGLKTTISTTDGYYFVGRIRIKPFLRMGTAGVFDLEAVCNPYMYKNDVTSVDLTIDVTGTLIETFVNDMMDTLPTFVVSATTQIVFGTYSVTVSAGSHQLASIIFEQGNNVVTFNSIEGTTINVSYQEGAL